MSTTLADPAARAPAGPEWCPGRLIRGRDGQWLIMWLFLTRRFRTWLLLTVVVPLVSGLLRRIGETLQARNGSSRISRTLLKAGSIADRMDARRGRRGRR